MANLIGAGLNEAHLQGSDLRRANLRGAYLCWADLSGSDLRGSNLQGTDLREADLSNASLSETIFGNTDLRGAKGLENCKFRGPCTLDHRTIQRSGALPLPFLRGCGLPDSLIEYLPSLLNEAISSSRASSAIVTMTRRLRNVCSIPFKAVAFGAGWTKSKCCRAITSTTR
jgi:hypothetical protein